MKWSELPARVAVKGETMTPRELLELADDCGCGCLLILVCVALTAAMLLKW